MAKSSTRLRAPSSPQLDLARFRSLFQLPPLPKSFYLQDTLTVAEELIGKGLIVGKGTSLVVTQIVEVEAYLGTRDPASHAYRGLTKRNWPMFEEGGTCYVYLSYGINYCMNVSTQGKGIGEAVLLRALRPLYGLELIKQRRHKIQTELGLLSGPGKITLGLGIGPEMNGRTFFEPDFKIVDLGDLVEKPKIAKTPRIGISKAAERPWRFIAKGSLYVSKGNYGRKNLQ
jgi:DNA-3-methyladenine glycosylase